MKIPTISIVICTYNRAKIFSECLIDLIEKISQYQEIRIIIVDNNSTDETADVVQRLAANNLVYTLESKRGLSHARNKGCQVATTDWVLFLDDDAIVKEGFFQRLQFVLSEYKFDCIGGTYYAWFPFGHPKWIPSGFGTKEKIRKSIGLIDGSDGWLSGGCMAVKKTVLAEIGGFDPSMGMKGKTIAYGEETLLQMKLVENGYKIGFDPELAIDHAVLPHKLKLSWHLKNSFARGIYAQALTNQGTYRLLIFHCLKSSFGALLKHLPRNMVRCFIDKHYYIENLILDTFKPPLWYLGVLYKKLSSA